MSHKHHGNPVATYIVTALILGVITYMEFALVEYDVAWLSRAATIFWLIALSVVKFVMVVAIFMHLKDDEKTYTGFFSSGLLIALATFLVLPLLFTVRNLSGQVAAQPQAAHAEAVHEEPALSEEARSAIDSEGYSRPRSDVLDTPPPMRRSLAVQPPAAAEPQASLRDDAAAGETAEQDAQAQAEQPAQEEQPAQAEQLTQEEQAEQPAVIEFDRALGERTYASTCQGCHQPGGVGLPGAFPPLAGHMPSLYNAEGGREYLIDVLLYGLTGQIQVNGQTYNGNMPAWPGLSDEQIAAVLNHELTAWGNDAELESFTPILPDEVAARRGESPGNLNERRAELQGQ
jgi:mono/diheme cytochrome c family protein/heme/copper-type cytochrome/quinol oxidase subunit 4